MATLEKGHKLTISEAEALDAFLSRSWGGKGGPQSAIAKLKTAFGYENRVEQLETVSARSAAPVVNVPSNGPSDLAAAMERLNSLQAQVSDALVSRTVELENALGQINGSSVRRASGNHAATTPATATEPAVTPRKGRKGAKKGAAMAGQWADAKAAGFTGRSARAYYLAWQRGDLNKAEALKRNRRGR